MHGLVNGDSPLCRKSAGFGQLFHLICRLYEEQRAGCCHNVLPSWLWGILALVIIARRAGVGMDESELDSLLYGESPVSMSIKEKVFKNFSKRQR